MKRRNLPVLWITILCGALIFMTSCSKPADKQSVAGKYLANHGKGADSIEINPDGTYVHIYAGAGGSLTENRGKWTFEIENTKPRITFSGFTFMPALGPSPTGYWDVEVKNHWGHPRLTIDSDLNLFYEKSSK